MPNGLPKPNRSVIQIYRKMLKQHFLSMHYDKMSIKTNYASFHLNPFVPEFFETLDINPCVNTWRLSMEKLALIRYRQNWEFIRVH